MNNKCNTIGLIGPKSCRQSIKKRLF